MVCRSLLAKGAAARRLSLCPYGVVTDPSAQETPFNCLSYASVRYVGKRSRRLGVRIYGTGCREDAGGSGGRQRLPEGT
jgi:hypothetical protein